MRSVAGPGSNRSLTRMAAAFCLALSLVVLADASHGVAAEDPAPSDWELSGLTGPVRDLLVASAPGVIFVRTTDGLFRSDDGGTTWTALAAPPPLGRVTLDPANPRTLYAAGLGGLYKSVDDGVTWQLVLPLSDQQTESILSIAVSPAEPSLIYLAVAPVWPQPGRFRFLRSRDGGLSWDTIEERQQSSCAWSVRILYPHPSDATAVFRTAGCYASRNLEAPLELSGDQGASWSPVFRAGTVFPDYLVGGTGVAPGRFYLAGNRDARAGGSAIFRTDDGANWNEALSFRGGGTLQSPELPNVGIGGLAYNAQQPDCVYVALTRGGSGVLGSQDGGSSWQPVGRNDVGSVSGLALSVDRQQLFAVTDQGLWRLSVSGHC